MSTEAAPALATWRAAVAALAEGGALDLGLLASAYRAFPPFTHPRAGDAAPDLDLLAGLWAMGGEVLFRARHLHLTPSVPRSLPRATPLDEDTALLHLPRAPHALGDGLALALALHVEGDKLRGLAAALPPGPAAPEVLARVTGASPGALAARFGDLDAAVRATRALARGGPTHLSCERADEAAPVDALLLNAALDKDAAVFVCAGATEILHDLISPYARRLGPRLDALTGAPGDEDARYDGIALLVTEAPDAHRERLELEARDGLTEAGAALVVRTRALPGDAADPRARVPLRALRDRGVALLLTGRDPRALDEALSALGPRVAGVALFVEGAPAPAQGFAHLPAAHGAGAPIVAPGRAPREVPLDHGRVAVPSLGLCPAGVRGVTLLDELSAVCGRRLADGALPMDLRLVALCVAPGDVRAAAEAGAFALDRFARAA